MKIDQLINEVARTKEEAGKLTVHQQAERLAVALAEFTAAEENQRFAGAVRPAGNYMRILLNSSDDPFQVVLVLWQPGRGSPIHDHSGTVGAVSALLGHTREVKYQITGRVGSRVTLAEKGELVIRPAEVTRILPEDDEQLHMMVNETAHWAATVHVYLDAITSYRLYEPEDGDRHLATETRLRFDRADVWRDMPLAGGTDVRVR
ncbi:cysteine dioxygenase [Saccharothrix obliqua]|uniref:cysteine dioxygenase n=1 Tax=Saccharothrix obliqua TaxID=2861747 RepID=UPI001C5D3E69|nr:cysteine dioxygenase family protein [Saccharothrix obliqua]MBW4718809.1 cysteine dioxygenase family protein [Saccharothrix obliqua]